ncbi:MAG TPA: hypothetical protein ENJ61_00285 [Aquifex aeolicus]|uniref:Lipoprotein n=1 Tax=Aquifex aeolicus TaxID=63363 RepID=A0A7C5L8A8_AQUAO|nr:hypothetical protein [Aquifex aeolicus]
MKGILILCVFLSLLVGSCGGLLLPYHEEPLCRREGTVGFCGSLSEIYRDMEENPEKYGIGGSGL